MRDSLVRRLLKCMSLIMFALFVVTSFTDCGKTIETCFSTQFSLKKFKMKEKRKRQTNKSMSGRGNLWLWFSWCFNKQIQPYMGIINNSSHTITSVLSAKYFIHCPYYHWGLITWWQREWRSSFDRWPDSTQHLNVEYVSDGRHLQNDVTFLQETVSHRLGMSEEGVTFCTENAKRFCVKE